ncbi:hypothetical protein ACQEU5_02230 [Marinactinospora thermotolerans]|uniref:Uncharacterized protein n=1 Tax=Marinactinospora thermotolerans DSM 45154 TaxID=1122192 RepID=A0A1T4LXY7_9ACTN|nr:hypothetical protein [Marinactinospora thermotolerans]SJZ59501.1 hypothetical protein SAMN02745673_00862 [Marinactinospora thermotolerans DSM 45154]
MRNIQRAIAVGALSIPAALGLGGVAFAGDFFGNGAFYNESGSFAGPKGSAAWETLSAADGFGNTIYYDNESFAGEFGAASNTVVAGTG